MAIQNDPLKITPYTSTVPLVQSPVEQNAGMPAQPLQGNFSRKGTGALYIGDALLKGFMQGHQQKEQRNRDKARMTIAAADAAAESAYQTYQQNLQKLGPQPDQSDPKFTQWKQQADGYYTDYKGVWQQSKDAKFQFLAPPKKGEKGASAPGTAAPSGDKKKKNPVSAGFNNIGDFFAANPHIVPQIAYMTMQPKPPGLSPQAQEQSLQLQGAERQNREGQRIEQAQKIYDAGSATFSRITDEDSLPPDVKKDYDTWVSAKNILYPLKETGKDRVWTNGKDFISLTPGQAPPAGSGYYPYEKGPTQGSDAELENKYLASIGVDRKSASTEQLAAATQYARTAKIPQTATTSTSTTTPQGDRTTTTTRKATPGAMQPPPAASRQASPASAGISKPPTAKASPTGQGAQGIGRPPQSGKTAKAGEKSGITPPPGGKQTATTAAVTRQATQKQQEGYRKAEEQYKTDLAKADKEFTTAVQKAAGDQAALQAAQQAKDAAYARAKTFLDGAKQSVAEEYDAAVKSIGGTTGSGKVTEDTPPPGASARVKDAQGKLIGYAVDGQFVPLGK